MLGGCTHDHRHRASAHHALKHCVYYQGCSDNIVHSNVVCATNCHCHYRCHQHYFYHFRYQAGSAHLQEPSASGTPTVVFNASAPVAAGRKLLQAASNVTATFGYQTTPAVASSFSSSFNTSQFNQALDYQGKADLSSMQACS